MKRIYLVFSFLFGLTLTTFSQEVPENVTKNFNEKFPTVEKVEWILGNEKDWEAKFKLKEADYISNYDAKGNWVQTCHEISRGEVPIPIRAKSQKEFVGYRMESAKKVEKPSFAGYSVRLFKMEGEEKDEIEVLFDEAGQVVSMDKISNK